MRKLAEEGVHFQSPVNGDDVFLTPEKSIEVQHELNADVTMIFDECTPYPATESDARESMQLSLRWAVRSRRRFDELKNEEPERGEALVRHRAGRHLRHAARGVARWPDAYRFRRLRDRRTGGRRTAKTSATRYSMHCCRRCPMARLVT